MAKNTAVFGIYQDKLHVEAAVDTLVKSGFRTEDISVLVPQNIGTKDFAYEKHTKAPEGAATGGTTGAVVVGVLGLLAGIGVIAIPGLGPLLAAGPIVAVLTGVGAGGVVGGIIGALAGLGIPEYEAKRYEGLVRKGHVLLSAHCDNSEWVKRAKQLLASTGALHISATGEAAGDYAESDRPKVRYGGGGTQLSNQ
jgi:hypothetical protein